MSVQADGGTRRLMRRLVVRGARILDPAGGPPIEDGTLVAEEGRIVWVGPAREAPDPPGDADLVDAGGRSLLPGLIDCHVHLCFEGSADLVAETAGLSVEMAALRAARNARRTLEAGITTVRDLGGRGLVTLEVARAQAAGVIEGPRIVACGEALTITGGHFHFSAREVDTAEELVKAVRSLVKAGAGCIKLVASGGVLTPDVSLHRAAFTVEQLSAAAGEAREAGRRVAAHAIGERGILAALHAGVDSIEHGCYLGEEALKLLAGGSTWLVPTLAAPDRILAGGGGIPAEAVAKAREVSEAHRASVARAAEAGVRIAAGTDAGTPFNPHGGLALELRLMHEAGLPLADVLRAATAEAAALLGLEDLGVLQPGAAADLLLLDGDPLADVSAYGRVALVAQAGRVVVDRLDGGA